MRPVLKSSSNPNYSPPTTFTFSRAHAVAVQSVLKLSGTSFPVQQCLDLWLRINLGDKSLGGSAAQQKQAEAAIKAKVLAAYKCAGVPLMDELGRFCSFCETAQPGLLEVEHCVPKSQYPTFALEWSNFLLACSPCNKAKSANPSRANVQNKWLSGSSANEQNFYDEIRKNHYVWADLDSRAYKIHPLQMEFYDSSAAAWTVVPMSEAAALDNSFHHAPGTCEVMANILDPAVPGVPTYKRGSVRVTIVSGSSSRSDEMIELCKLNECGNRQSTYDRRLQNRTKAWFDCLLNLRSYQIAERDPDPAAAKNSWAVLLRAATALGFYSVWLTILHWHDPLLARRFVTDTNLPDYFPGTDVTNLP
jgi:HNH endonuclease